MVGDVEHPWRLRRRFALYAVKCFLEAGGPTSKGSLRIVKHLRGNQLIQESTFTIICCCTASGRACKRLETGDTVLVPPLGSEVTITGMVRRPAIYNLTAKRACQRFWNSLAASCLQGRCATSTSKDSTRTRAEPCWRSTFRRITIKMPSHHRLGRLQDPGRDKVGIFADRFLRGQGGLPRWACVQAGEVCLYRRHEDHRSGEVLQRAFARAVQSARRSDSTWRPRISRLK